MDIGYFTQAALLGLSAALLPGALQAFFFAQALRLGRTHALILALTPLLSDGPLVVAVLVLLRQVPPAWMRALAVIGGVYLLYLAWNLFRTPEESANVSPDAGRIRTLFQAITINWLNPNPYVFWTTVLGPLVLKGWAVAPTYGLGFIAVFYGVMVLGNTGLIWLFGTMHGLPMVWRRRLVRFAALVLAGMGLRLLWG